MPEFKRTWEKVLAWIANIVLLLVTGLAAAVSFSGVITTVKNDAGFKQAFMNAMQQERVVDYDYDAVMMFVESGAKVWTVIFIIATVLALIATFTMKSRVLSGILFLITAIIVGIASIGVLILVYALHFIVAILLFVRKEPTYNNYNDNNYQKEVQVDKVEYM